MIWHEMNLLWWVCPEMVGHKSYVTSQLFVYLLAIYYVRGFRMVRFHGPVWYPPSEVYMNPLYSILFELAVLVL